MCKTQEQEGTEVADDFVRKNDKYFVKPWKIILHLQLDIFTPAVEKKEKEKSSFKKPHIFSFDHSFFSRILLTFSKDLEEGKRTPHGDQSNR
jgi:hypothetical protein